MKKGTLLWDIENFMYLTQPYFSEDTLTENVPKTLSKAPCLVAKRMSLTLHLLLFKQSM